MRPQAWWTPIGLLAVIGPSRNDQRFSACSLRCRYLLQDVVLVPPLLHITLQQRIIDAGWRGRWLKELPVWRVSRRAFARGAAMPVGCPSCLRVFAVFAVFRAPVVFEALVAPPRVGDVFFDGPVMPYLHLSARSPCACSACPCSRSCSTLMPPTSRVLWTWVPPSACRSTPTISTMRILVISGGNRLILVRIRSGISSASARGRIRHLDRMIRRDGLVDAALDVAHESPASWWPA